MIKKAIFILIILGVFVYFPVQSTTGFQIEIQDWEKKQELLNIDKKQVEGWGWKALNINEKRVVNRKIRVAIIDSGIDREHSDLKGIIKKEYNAINSAKSVVDDTGHGTSVAGIIGAIDNGKGIRGVSDSNSLEIYSIKAFSNNTSKVEYLERALKWAIQNNVDIINFSAGTAKESPKLLDLINEATSKNIIIVAAAGNNISNEVDFPARLDNVISVGAVNYNLKKLSGTSYGKIDFVGPGTNIITTQPNNSYGYFGFTSAATAYVSGVIANKISSYTDKDNYTLNSILDELKNNSIDLKNKDKYGYGFIQD